MSDIPAKIIRSRRRTLTLDVLPDKSLLIKAPFFITQPEIDNFIQKHQKWIEKRVNLLQHAQLPISRKYVDGEHFFYLGEMRRLTIGKYTEIAIRKDTLIYPDFLTFRIEKELRAWFVKQAQKIITEQVGYYAKRMKTSYKSLKFSDTRSKWGSCTHDNRLQFSWRLVMVPLLVLNYVVIHELAHTIEKNHSLAFWKLVRSQSPSYRQQRKWLKENGHTLII